MPTLRNIQAALLISLGAAAMWLGLPAMFPRSTGNPPSTLIAAAAAAWVNVHCAANVRLMSGAPRLMAEDLLRLSGEFDAERSRKGLDAACRDAGAAAAKVSEPASPPTPAPRRANEAVALRQ